VSAAILLVLDGPETNAVGVPEMVVERVEAAGEDDTEDVDEVVVAVWGNRDEEVVAGETVLFQGITIACGSWNKAPAVLQHP
jgi:hypothetical protein